MSKGIPDRWLREYISKLEVDSKLQDKYFSDAISFLAKAQGTEVFNWSDYKDFSVVPVSDFKRTDVYSGSKCPEKIWKSSGTTGESVSKVKLQDTKNYDQVIEKEWKYFVNPAGEENRIYLSLIPSSREWEHSSLAYMFDKALSNEPVYRCVRDVTESSFSIDTDAVVLALSDADVNDWPVVIYGTTYAIKWLVDWSFSNGVQLDTPGGSIVVHTGGYKGKTKEISNSELVFRIGQRLSVDPDHIITEYGMSELSSQMWTPNFRAYTQGIRTYGSWRDDTYQVPSWVRVRVVDEDEEGNLVDVPEGERGTIVVYDLANIWSACAIKTQDIGSVTIKDDIQYLRVYGREMEAPVKGCSLAAESAIEGNKGTSK